MKLSDQITRALGTDDWLILHDGHHLVTADDLDAKVLPDEPAPSITEEHRRMSKIIKGNSLNVDTRSMLPVPHGDCDGGYCERRAVSFAYDEGISALIPVCRRHILVYQVGPRDAPRRLWQAEDEFSELRFARRSRWRWLAQRRILSDQRAAMAGRESRAQRRRRIAADVEVQTQRSADA